MAVQPDTTGATMDAFDDVIHTGPGTLAGRYLRLFWHPVLVADRLPAGRAIPIRVMSEDFTLYRGQSGAPHVVSFRCAHRGTQLSTGWVEGDDLRCFYHGWKYDAGGQCVEQPAEPEPFCQRIRIRSYPTAEYLGLIFAYLGEGNTPPLPRYPNFEEEGGLKVGSYVRECNYFNSIENGVDAAHLAFVHRRSGFADHGLVDIPIVAGEETAYGMEVRAKRPSSPVRITQAIMPNLLYITGSPEEAEVDWRDELRIRVPIDDETHASYSVDLIHANQSAAPSNKPESPVRPTEPAVAVNRVAASILRGELHVDDVGYPPNLVALQDTVAQVGQGVIPDHGSEHLGRSDATVMLLRSLWRRELRALAEGRPLKAWTIPGRLEATAGV
jgi:5,5'-dehydrodivanillate O-demethylase oxygenase subunit